MEKSTFDPKTRFGQRLRDIRISKNLTQENLAAKAGLDRTYVSSCERGKRNVTLEVVYKLSDALGVSPKELVPDQYELEGF